MTNDLSSGTARFAAAVAGRYEIVRELGAGGMAIVFLARDVRHDRQVALKILRPDVAAAIGGERFLAEIKTTANLQHPHIVPLHDSGEVNGVVFYVMPFVEGEGLRDRLNRERQLPIADAIRLATHVASALDYAHRRNVVHRDIKPENILVHDGAAVVADFGIALAVESAGGQRLTQTGLSLGTPQYMSPEQATGERTVDGRADVYALAAVLYEMLIGEPPFTGPTVQAIVARTLTELPRALVLQRHAVPPHIEAAVLKALEKLPADRFSTAGEFAQALAADAHVAGARHDRAVSPHWRKLALGLGLATALLAATLSWFVRQSSSGSGPPLVTSRITPSPDAPSELHDVALSPDGSTLAYVSSAAADGGRIWLRTLATGTTRSLNDTEGARGPFWAPDGSGIGFFAAGQLHVVSISSGSVRTIAPAPLPAGGAWGPDGTIVYSPFFRRLWKVPAAGGTPTHALTVGDDQTDGSREPRFLPDGHHFVFWRSVTIDAWVGDLATGIGRKLADSMTAPVYVEPGILLFFQQTGQASLEQPAPLMARRFNARRLAFDGEPVVLSPRVDRPDQVAIVSASRDFLVLREPSSRTDAALGTGAGPGSEAHGTIYWLDRATGRRSDPVKGTGSAWAFRAAHDGRRFALAGPGLSIYDAQRDVSVRHPARIPVGGWPQAWSPDDREVALNAGPHVLIVSVDGSTNERRFDHDESTWAEPVDWSPDGAIYYLSEPTESRPHNELWRHNLGTGKNEHVSSGSGNIFDARLSPNWQWIAWESDESGRHEIYLGEVKGGATPVRVSKAGGGSPRWRRDGKELFYVGGDGRIMAVDVQLAKPPVVGEPHRVADLVIHPEPMGVDPYLDTRFEPSPAGDRFLVQTPLGAGTHELTLIQGWQRLLSGRR